MRGLLVTNYDSFFFFLITTKSLQIATGITNYDEIITNYDRTHPHPLHPWSVNPSWLYFSKEEIEGL